MVSASNTVNKLSVADEKLTITSYFKVNSISVASIGIKGESGKIPVTLLDQNKILSNDGTNVEWIDTPTNLNLNGGYF